MGCASSRVGPTVSHVPENATIPNRIRRRLDSIRRRRRVADSLINAGKEPTSLSLSKKQLLLEATESDKLTGSSPNASRDDLDQEEIILSTVSEEEEESPVGAAPPNNNSMPLERDRADCIAEAVKRAIDDVMLEEEEEEEKEAAADHGNDDDGRRVVARGRDDGDDGGELVCIGSPSFRFYCEEGPKPFGSFASIDFEVKSVGDLPKAIHESTESFESKGSIESQPTLIPDMGGSTSSSKSRKLGRRKKGGSYRKKGALGMSKMLLNMSCYSCAAHPDRNRQLVHN